MRDNAVPFPINFEFIDIAIGEFGVGIFFGGKQRIGGFLGEFDSSGTKKRDDRVSDRSLSPESSSGVGNGETIIGIWVGSSFNHGDIETFGYIGKVGYSRAITGSARERSKLNKAYGSEDDEYSDDDDKLNKGESFICFGSGVGNFFHLLYREEKTINKYYKL